MRKYPTDEMIIPESELGPEFKSNWPTPYAIENFLTYFEDEDLKIYNEMSPFVRKNIARAYNPFLMFKILAKGDFDYIVKENNE